LEAFLAAQCQNIGQRCELANAVHLEQCLRLRILRLGELLDGTVSAATRRNSHRRRLGCATAPTTSLMQDALAVHADRDWRFSRVHCCGEHEASGEGERHSRARWGTDNRDAGEISTFSPTQVRSRPPARWVERSTKNGFY
jgi:hypothetical protein